MNKRALAMVGLALATGGFLLTQLFGGSESKGQAEPPIPTNPKPKSSTGAIEPQSARPNPVLPTSDIAEKKQRYEGLKARLHKAAEQRAQRQNEKPASTNDMEVPRSPMGHLDRDYIQAQMKEILPLFRECYDQALERDSSLQGKVVIRTTIIGEEEIGGLVETSEVIAEESDIRAPEFLECVQETAYALELPAPEGGGTVTIKYPMIFRTEEDQ